jgi:hypothetical protein
MKLTYFIIFMMPLFHAGAQISLLSSIGISALPSDADSICTIPVSSPPGGDFGLAGFNEGDTIPHFRLYTPDGISVDIEDELKKGLPVLLISGSYTCPVYRSIIDDMNAIASDYAGEISVFNIYVVEAHPIVDMNPYSGVNNVTQNNYDDSVLYEQPETYGERKWVIAEMEKKYPVTPDILIDGICNEWWLNFGPAPNNAYLVNTNGIIFSKQGWFNKAPENMSDDIDSLLSLYSASVKDINKSSNGSLSLYPGPSSSEITLNLEGKDYIENIVLLSSSGTKIMEKRNQQKRKITIDIASLPHGIYFAEIITQQQRKLCVKFMHQ